MFEEGIVVATAEFLAAGIASESAEQMQRPKKQIEVKIAEAFYFLSFCIDAS